MYYKILPDVYIIWEFSILLNIQIKKSNIGLEQDKIQV